MTAKQTMKLFKELFPYLLTDIMSYKSNKDEGGIDISLVNEYGFESVFNFKIEGHNQWTLKRVR